MRWPIVVVVAVACDAGGQDGADVKTDDTDVDTPADTADTYVSPFPDDTDTDAETDPPDETDIPPDTADTLGIPFGAITYPVPNASFEDADTDGVPVDYTGDGRVVALTDGPLFPPPRGDRVLRWEATSAPAGGDTVRLQTASAPITTIVSGATYVLEARLGAPDAHAVSGVYFQALVDGVEAHRILPPVHTNSWGRPAVTWTAGPADAGKVLSMGFGAEFQPATPGVTYTAYIDSLVAYTPP